MPRVSVVLTSFNHSAYLNESIDSVLGQTFSDIELIVLDDASEDNSWALISRYTDQRMRAYLSSKPGQVTHQISKALSNAVGEYIAVQHSDDVWMPEKLARQVAYLDAHPEIGAVFTWVQGIDETGAMVEQEWFNRPNQPRWAWLNELFNEKNALNNPSALLRKSCYAEIGGHRFGLAQTDDAEFWSRLLIRHPIHVLDEKLTMHRIFSDKSNVSGDRPEVAVRSRNEWNFLRENFLALPGFDEIVEVFPELKCWRRANGCSIKFLLAMACVRSSHRSAWSLGLRFLFELLNSTVQRDQLAQLYGFTDFSFVELSATLDCYLVNAIREHHQTVAQYEARLQSVLSEATACTAVLEADLQSARASRDEAAAAGLRVRDELSIERTRAAVLEADLQSARASRDEAAAAGLRARDELSSERTRAAALEADLHSERDRAGSAEDEARVTAARYEAVRAELARLETSSVWRATAPLRNAMARRPRAARRLRQAAKLMWWTVSLQLVGRLRAWHHAQPAPRAIVPVALLSSMPPPLVDAPLVDAPLVDAPLVDAPLVDALLVDWLAACHSQARREHVPILEMDALLGYFRDIGVTGDTASLFATTLQEGFNPTARKQLNETIARDILPNQYLVGLAQEVIACPFFDAQDYATRTGLKAGALEVALHYLLLGEPLGLSPSTKFDPSYYMLCHDDLRLVGCNALLHYTRSGLHEGRQPFPNYSAPVAGQLAADPKRENIILTVHETSRTGAPILGWNIASRLAAIYNVYTVRLGEGSLTPSFEAISVEVHGPFSKTWTTDIDAGYGLRPLLIGKRFKYAIVNSIECRALLQAFTSAGVPTVLLVHEFGSYVRPSASLTRAFRDASEIVFPAPIVARSSLDCDPALAARTYRVIPQGMSQLPRGNEVIGNSEDAQIQTLAALRANGTMIVLGAGRVEMRKGVDLFMGVAAGVQRHVPARPVHFVWVGGGYRPQDDLDYSLYVQEQYNRAELADHFTFIDAVVDLEPIYALADVFLLTSRLDPLPNVTIDAAMRGIPIICFKNASGMADLLQAEPGTHLGVVPYLDIAAAVNVIVRLAEDESLRDRLAAKTKQFAVQIFDMDRYVEQLDQLGGRAMVRKVVEAPCLRASPSIWFDACWYEAEYGIARDHAGYVTDGLAAGHIPGPLAAHILAKFFEEMRFSPALYEQFQSAADWKQPLPLDALWLLTELYVPAWHERPGLEGFLTFLRRDLAADVKPGPLFDAAVYRARATAAGLPPLEPGESAIVHWLRHGVAARVVPTIRFDEDFYRANNLDLRTLATWGFAHFIQHGVRESRAPSENNKFYRPRSPIAAARLPPLYEAWHAEDFGVVQGFAGITTADEERLAEVLHSTWLAERYHEMRAIEPGIGAPSDIRHYLLPPYQDALTAVHAALRTRLPSVRYDTVICVPWIRTGGADLVAGLLAGTLLRIRPEERVLVLRTDNPHFERTDWLPAAADCADMSDLRAGLTEAEAQKLLRVFCRGVGARRVFNVNSRLCWTALRDNQANMAATHANYAYLFCWDQTPDGTRVGYPAEFFTATAASITAFLTDTEYLKTQLIAQYQPSPKTIAKIVPLATPAQTDIRPVAIAREIADGDPLSPCVLWAGRLDRQKRFGLVREIATLMPETTFRCWGTALLDAPPDLSELPPNMVMEGTFETFDDLPLAQAGVWLFTSSWEGMPTTIIELAMRGVAIVASAVGGVPELVTLDTGWPLPPEATASDYAAALYAALEDPAGAAERAKALQARAAARHDSTAYDAALSALLDQEQAL
jgi:glycosyltransferase involved in cell wall biosynthesis